MGLSLHPDAPPAGTLAPVPASVPRAHGTAFGRWVGRTVLRLGGWRMVGAFPDLPRAVLIGAPHSSNWDGIWGLAAKLALGIDIRILGKDTLMRVPAMGALLHRLGVIGVNRSAPAGVVEQAAALLRGPVPVWFGLAPEGTRRPVERWKTGFWKIARAADVPIVPAYFHYPDRVIGIGPVVHATDDLAADMARLRAWYAPWQGKHRGTT